MWIARDKNGDLNLFTHRPLRFNGEWLISDIDLIHNGAKYMPIDNRLFPNLKWKDEPIEVDLLIKKK